jgi:hypothetical protein
VLNNRHTMEADDRRVKAPNEESACNQDSASTTVNEPMEAPSELMVLSTWGNTRNMLTYVAEMKGPFDYGAARGAVKDLVDNHPHLLSTVREIRQSGRNYLVSEYRPDFKTPVFESRISDPDKHSTTFNAILAHLHTTLERQRDLRKEPPFEVHIIRMAEQHHAMTFLFHHVAADAGKAMELSMEILAGYDVLVKGQQSKFFESRHVISAYKKRAVVQKKGSRLSAVSGFLSDIDMLFKKKPARPLGKGQASDLREFHVKRVLSKTETSEILKTFTQRKLPLVDQIFAQANATLDTWNSERGEQPGTITNVLTVNSKNRFPIPYKINNSSALFLRFGPEQRKDLFKFARRIGRERAKLLREQMDFKYRRDMDSMRNILAFLPFSLRQQVFHYIAKSHVYSIDITFLGVLMPADRDERSGEESDKVSVGDTDLVAMYGTIYKQMGGTSLSLYTFLFKDRLNIVLVAPGSLLTEEECGLFLDLLCRKLVSGFPKPG